MTKMKLAWVLSIAGFIATLISLFIYLFTNQEVGYSVAFLFLLAGLILFIWSIFAK